MKRGLLVIVILLFGMLASRVVADGTMHVSKPAVQEPVIAAIEAQLAAFRGGEVAKAYELASEELRRHTPLRMFARMVQVNYPEIWQSTRAEFGLVRDDGARATVVVKVFAANAHAAYDYVLFKESAGWRIGGVLRREAHPADGV